jgi:hypothetical protein
MARDTHGRCRSSNHVARLEREETSMNLQEDIPVHALAPACLAGGTVITPLLA